MEKANKIRFVLWGLVWLVVLCASGYGLSSYLKGYGKSGKLRQEIYPIVETFNNLNKVKRYDELNITLEASLIKNGINVKYSTNNSTLNFPFTYETIDNEKVLHTKYKVSEETQGLLITNSLFDAISVHLGHEEDELFEKYEFGELYKTSIADGGSIVTSSDMTNVYINVNKTLLETMTEEVLKNKYFNETDLANLATELTKENTYNYKYEKENTKLYIEITEDKYIIYIRNGYYDKNLYKSMKAVINALPIEKDVKDLFEANYSSVDETVPTISFDNYSITLNTNVETVDYFSQKDKVVKIEVNKGKSTIKNNNKTNVNTEDTTSESTEENSQEDTEEITE